MAMTAMARLEEEHLTVCIAKVFPLEQAATALQFKAPLGRVVLTVS